MDVHIIDAAGHLPPIGERTSAQAEDEDHDFEAADEPPSCPHIDRNDERCGQRFRLGRLEQAFKVCFGSWHGCAVFHRLNGELATAQPAQRRLHFAGDRPAPVEITINGRAEIFALRPTGS